MNEHDSERIAGLLSADGMERTDDLEQADVVVLNTCCIRENADDKLYGHLGHLKSLRDRRPELQIAVGGCLAQKDRDLIQRRAPHVDVVFGTHNVGRAVELLHEAYVAGPLMEVLEESDELPSAFPAQRRLPYAAWVTIQVGCDNRCAFCIVPAVRGREMSRSFGDIVAEVEGLAAAGVVEVTLLGQNVNSYGRDLTTSLRGDAMAGTGAWVATASTDRSGAVAMAGDAWVSEGARRPRPLFADLLRAVGSVPGISRVRFTSPHPKDLRPDVTAAMAGTPAVCEHLHLPLQSGSDRTLAAMHRGYTAERYLARLAEARSAIQDLAVTTDIIVGFPGETDDDFERTLEVVAEAEYDSAYTFLFSARPGTEAASMTEHFVPDAVAAERFARLKIVLERSGLARHQARIGRLEEVLVEGPSRKDASVLAARTRQNKLVHFREPTSTPGGPLKPGSFASVRITGGAPHHLTGELVEVLAAPRHRTMIAVSAG
jgi:tRNA-2-methylthio-N6-dimethylallyladenosine synthase